MTRYEHFLCKRINHEGKLMTKQQWLNMWRIKGAIVEEKQVPKVEFSRTKYNRMNGYEQAEYEKKLKEMKTEYRLNINEREFYTISKIEYEYFNNCELADDLAAEKNARTDEQEMQKEFEFAKKYFD